jgi:hypothetical protein
MHEMPASRFPCAEQIARRTPIDGDIEQTLRAWLEGYRMTARGRYEPCVEEAQAAEAVLEERLAGGVPDLPTSSSSAAWPHVPGLVRGVPRTRGR